jgi:hypothetical protein
MSDCSLAQGTFENQLKRYSRRHIRYTYHIYTWPDHSLPWHGTDTSMKSVGGKLVVLEWLIVV